MKNGVKNGNKTQFSTTNQPSSESKSAGWTRKRMAQEFLDKVFEYQDMTISEFNKICKLVDKQDSKRTVRELMAVKYVEKLVSSDKVMIDWINRHIPKVEYIEEENKQINEVRILVINKHREFNDSDIPPV